MGSTPRRGSTYDDVAAFSAWISASRLLDLGEATLFVTVCALFLGIAGTALRVWATAYLGGGMVTGGKWWPGALSRRDPFAIFAIHFTWELGFYRFPSRC